MPYFFPGNNTMTEENRSPLTSRQHLCSFGSVVFIPIQQCKMCCAEIQRIFMRAHTSNELIADNHNNMSSPSPKTFSKIELTLMPCRRQKYRVAPPTLLQRK